MEREQKDTLFSIHPHSPDTSEEREKFKGLDYHPPDPDPRFKLNLHEHLKKKTIKVSYTRGEEQQFLRCGEFQFKIGDQQHALQAYKSSPEEERLFVLFRDTMRGKETHGAGRCLDLEPDRDCTGEGKWILDFN